MLTCHKAVSLNGFIDVKDAENNNVTVMVTYGTKTENDEISINENILNQQLYKLHKEEVDEEFSEFIELVRELEV